MAERDPHQLLLDAVASPLAADGGFIVGLCGSGIPEEPLIAAGAEPRAMLLRPGMPAPLAAQFLDATDDAAMQDLFQQLCDPPVASPQLAVLGPPYSQLTSIIEEVRRSGAIPRAVPVHYHELLTIQSRANRAFALERTTALASRVAAATGITPSAERLADAIELTNARRAVMHRFIELRRQRNVVSGAHAFRMLMAARRLPCAQYTAQLVRLNDALQLAPPLAARPRVLLAGSTALDHFRAHDAIEAAGAWVVAEDDPSGAHAAVEPIALTADPMRAIAEHSHRHCSGQHVYPRERRLAWLHEQAARADIDAVILYAEHPFFGWDFPATCEFLQRHGKRWLVVREDARTEPGYQRMVEQVTAFVAAAGAGR